MSCWLCACETDGNRLTTKQTRQITRVGAVGSTNYALNKIQAGAYLPTVYSAPLDFGMGEFPSPPFPSPFLLPSLYGWLGSRVVSVLDSGAEGPGFKSQPGRCRVTVSGKLTHITCRLTAKNRDQFWSPTLCNRVWTTFTFLSLYSVPVRSSPSPNPPPLRSRPPLL